jgi:hypothetical protein
MDWRSHRLFGGILLNKLEKDLNYDSWSLGPDTDIGPLHRWYRHRFSVLNEICRDSMEICHPISSETSEGQIGTQMLDKKGSVRSIDKDAVALCITSHFYLDMFSGYIAPFGILYPICPHKTVTKNMLENKNGTKVLINELNNLPITDEFSTKFYGASGTIMGEFVSDMSMFSLEEIVSMLVYRMGTCAQIDKRDNLYKKAIGDICNFTGNRKYADHGVRSWKDGFENFEHKYAKLINRFTEFL